MNSEQRVKDDAASTARRRRRPWLDWTGLGDGQGMASLAWPLSAAHAHDVSIAILILS